VVRALGTLSDLHARGLLTDDEFAAAKAQELGGPGQGAAGHDAPPDQLPSPGPAQRSGPWPDGETHPPSPPAAPDDGGPRRERRRALAVLAVYALGLGTFAAVAIASTGAPPRAPDAVPTAGATTAQTEVAGGYTGSSSWGQQYYQGGQPLQPPSSGDGRYEQQFAVPASNCSAGVMGACDVLYQITPGGDFYEWFGSSCAGRLSYETSGGCASTFGSSGGDGSAGTWAGSSSWGFAFYRAGDVLVPPSSGDALYDSRFAALADACAYGGLGSCDELYQATDVGSFYEWYGSSCAGRLDHEAQGSCAALLGGASPTQGD
jgi:Short C-terminal domain